MKTHKYRISEAAAGKILIKVMEMTRSSEISPEQFHDTMFAALNYIEAEVNPDPTANINPIKWQDIKERIDKSARRSKAARERAARRRQSVVASAAHTVAESYPETHQDISPEIVHYPKPSVSRPCNRNSASSGSQETEEERNKRLAKEIEEMFRLQRNFY